ncbi:MAG: glycosyltransferase family 2 protein [Archangiaceae bacterium]|nr:glycosyltransferase family 2 protein [Archangiaceae bacterium]
MPAPRISVVIPALNEEKGVVETIRRIPKVHEIIVVDGGSKDRTAEAATAAGAKVIIEKKRGYGLAHKTGFKVATGDVLATCDADSTYPVELFPHVADHLVRKKLSFINCSRFPLADRKSMPDLNKFGNVGLSLAASMLYLHTFRDISSGMWVFKRSLLERMELKTDGWVFSNELKLEAYFTDPKGFAEYTIPYEERTGHTHNVTVWKTGFEVLGFMVYERFNHFVRARVVSPNRRTDLPSPVDTDLDRGA